MIEKEIEEKINQGRYFMHCIDDEYESDQDLKKPQPPLVKKAMTDNRTILPRDFDSLDIINDFTKLLTMRKSSRVYTEENISLLQLSYLLWATQGVKSIRGKSYATLRTVPASGARHPFETYLLVQYVDGLKPGKYHYLPMEHSLEYLGECDNLHEIMGISLFDQMWASKASVIFYYSFVCYRSEWRYSTFAHRPALIDMGHVGENLYLSCTALKLGTCGVAAFDEELINSLFDLDGKEEFAVYTEAVGTVSEKDKASEQAFYDFVTKEGL